MTDKNWKPGRDPHSTIPLRPDEGSRRWVDPNRDSGMPCTKMARSKTELLDCLNKEQQRRPDDPAVRAMIYREVREVVDRDPYLEYHAENTQAYRVIDRAQQVLIVPKERAQPERFPVQRPEPLRKANRYQLFAILGLLFAGTGAVVFSLVSARYAFPAMLKERSTANQVRAGVSVLLSMALFVIGLALVYLLWLHISG